MNPSPLRLVLTEEQSAAIRESGIRFAVMGPGSYPGATGRSVLYLFECAQETAQAACGVALGTHRAAKIRTPAVQPLEPGLADDVPQTPGRRKPALTTQP